MDEITNPLFIPIRALGAAALRGFCKAVGKKEERKEESSLFQLV
jgi:hypothetical protein